MKNSQQACRGILPATFFLLCMTVGTLLMASTTLRAGQTDYLKRLAEITDPQTLVESEPRQVALLFVRSLHAMEILRTQGLEPDESIESALLRNGTDSLRRELLSRHLQREFHRFTQRGQSKLRVARLLPADDHPPRGHELLNYVLSGDLKPASTQIQQSRQALREVEQLAPPLDQLAAQLRLRNEQAMAEERQSGHTAGPRDLTTAQASAAQREAFRKQLAESQYEQQQLNNQRSGWTLPTIIDQRRAYNAPAYGYTRNYYFPAFYYYPPPPPPDCYDDGLKTRPAGIYKAPLGLKNEEPVRGTYIRVN